MGVLQLLTAHFRSRTISAVLPFLLFLIQSLLPGFLGEVTSRWHGGRAAGRRRQPGRPGQIGRS